MSSTCTEGQAKNVPDLLKNTQKNKRYGLARYRASSVTLMQLSWFRVRFIHHEARFNLVANKSSII